MSKGEGKNGLLPFSCPDLALSPAKLLQGVLGYSRHQQPALPNSPARNSKIKDLKSLFPNIQKNQMVIKKLMKQALKICLKNTQWDSFILCLQFVYSFRGQTL